jgi:hypothetical protein
MFCIMHASSNDLSPRSAPSLAHTAIMRRALLCVLPYALVSGRASAQATMFRGSSAHLGVYASAPPTLTNVVWKFRTQGRVLSSPAVSGDVVFVGSTDGRALRGESHRRAQQRWKLSDAARSGEFVAGGRRRSGLRQRVWTGTIYAVDDRTTGASNGGPSPHKGERRFTAPGIHGAMPRSERMPDPFDMFLSSPTVVRMARWSTSGAATRVSTHSTRVTGALRWRFATGDVVHSVARRWPAAWCTSGSLGSQPLRDRCGDGARALATTRPAQRHH